MTQDKQTQAEKRDEETQPAPTTTQRVEDIPVVAEGTQKAPAEITDADVDRLTGDDSSEDQGEQGDPLRLQKRRRWYDQDNNNWRDDDGNIFETEDAEEPIKTEQTSQVSG